MRDASFCLIAVAACAALLAPAADSARIEFGVPAQAMAALDGDGFQWAALIFRDESAVFSADLLPGDLANLTHMSFRFHPGSGVGGGPGQWLPPRGQDLPAMRLGLGFSQGWSSLVVAADRIIIEAQATPIVIDRYGAGQSIMERLPYSAYPTQLVRDEHEVATEQVGILLDGRASPLSVRLRAEGLRLVEWHNATTSCPGDPCPDGGRTIYLADQPTMGGLRQESFIQARPAGGSLAGTGLAFAVVLSSPSAHAALDGWMRLPRAQLSCDGCPDPSGGTLQAEGQVRLTNLTLAEGQALQAGYEGTLAHARVDESRWAPAATAAAASLVVLALLVKALLAGLFRSARSKRTHELRELIQRVPGMSWSQLRATLKTGGGNLDHHLRRLMESGEVVAYRHGRAMRYFENHGRYQSDWRNHACLQDPGKRRLHEWLARAGPSSQQSVLTETRSWGWSRSKTQRALASLGQGGLLAVEKRGRWRTYACLPPASLAPD